MDNLVLKQFDKELQIYELDWIDKLLNDEELKSDFKNPSLSFFTSMVYGFAHNLPYSMDIEQPEYVPADFLNMEPFDVEENNWFKYDDRRTFFHAMVSWGDSFKTGMMLQMCSLFQKMLLGQFPVNFELKNEDFAGWGISSMTKNMEYNRCFFETLKSLPSYYQKVTSANTNDERRKALEEIYAEIVYKISERYGGFKETGANGEVIRESYGTIPIRPHYDVEMLVHWEFIDYFDGIPEVIEAIKKEQLKKYIGNKPQSLSGNTEEKSLPQK